MPATKKSKITGKAVLEELKGPAMIIVGMIGGNMAGKAIDKALKVDPAQTGFNAKAMAKPVIQISAGVAGNLFLKDENLKLVATGLTASGVVSTTKIFLKKDLLAGLNGNGSGMIGNVKRFLKAQPYNPNLPELPDHAYETMDITYVDPGENLDEYQEVDEVEIL